MVFSYLGRKIKKKKKPEPFRPRGGGGCGEKEIDNSKDRQEQRSPPAKKIFSKKIPPKARKQLKKGALHPKKEKSSCVEGTEEEPRDGVQRQKEKGSAAVWPETKAKARQQGSTKKREPKASAAQKEVLHLSRRKNIRKKKARGNKERKVRDDRGSSPGRKCPL